MAAIVRRYRIDLGYDGTDFYGSQRQRGVRTVQEVVEDGLSRLSNGAVSLSFAGRTDRGVHAIGQVASVDLRWQRNAEALRYALDEKTPPDVSIVGVRPVGAGFHARFSASQREYHYRVWNAAVPPVLSRRFCWHVRADLDLTRLNDAAAALVGRKDFASLAGDGLGVPTSLADCTRRVTLAEWRALPEEWDRASSQFLEFRVRADRFLPHMVRTMVGNMVEVGHGIRTTEWFESMLAARDRRVAVAPAPPQGLVLWSVEYPEGAES